MVSHHENIQDLSFHPNPLLLWMGFWFWFGLRLFFVLVECHLLAIEILQKSGEGGRAVCNSSLCSEI